MERRSIYARDTRSYRQLKAGRWAGERPQLSLKLPNISNYFENKNSETLFQGVSNRQVPSFCVVDLNYTFILSHISVVH